ncbi:hypothetical protein PFICI_01057 [Pestalotiopsis fici W106-1]|uniref:Carboxylic ester hydrolase n=1 Tax=Pestalotiopsis fici (strain W106-1 / CGMCC3.15140) TaxID=1229662 RepID=W3XMM9_PESFW|nr:uncharacterized protein PFICI_01057 [Pestalotiopsis fici W106-1]ETS87229.1 hypothetical protein PFICI_01057 [Pestalotiopsis fici W106-1]
MIGRVLAVLPLALLLPGGHAICLPSSSTCASFLGHTFSNGTAVVHTAETIINGSTFTGTSANADYNDPQLLVPQACRLGLTIRTTTNSSVEAEIWLPPTAEWNQRLLTVGNGGFAGAINYPDVVWGLRKGFASVSTNTGHASNSSDGSFLSFPEQSINWGHRALHVSVMAAKEVVSSYYGNSTGGKLYSYYAGCSTGGRQGLNAAERYPEDFDGVLAGAVPWQTHVAGWQTYVALLQFPNTRASYIPATKWPFVAAAVLEQCDLLDGVADDIIMDPSKCTIDFAALTCGTGTLNSTACLSDEQAANLERMYTPWLANGTTGELVHLGISPSGEASFSYLMNGDEPQFGPTWFRHAIYNDSAWDWSTLTAADIFFSDTINPGGANAYDPDLRAFGDRGAKILHYHGYADPLIPTLSAAAWYATVQDFYGAHGRAGEVEDFYRLFMVPGMGHCSSGAGAWVLDAASQSGAVPPVEDASHSMLYSLVNWVEGGSTAAPESIIGTKYVEDVAPSVQFQRPICRWPAVAEYDGVGDADDSESWSCPVV